MSERSEARIGWFRNTAPYINLHRGATFVLQVPGAVQAEGALRGLLHDVALLSSLGVRLVLVHGARTQVEQRLAEAGLSSQLHRGRRITDTATLALVQQVVGAQRLQLEAQLSMGLPNSPMQGAKLRVGSGNFVVARPLGVVDGIDHQLTGCVRRIDTAGIRTLLDGGSVVLLSSLGFSPTGECFNLTLADVAVSAARALEADKLIILGAGRGVLDARGQLVRQCVAGGTERIPDATQAGLLASAVEACRGGVPRAHIVSYRDPDALLTELFTTDGSGTLVAERPYEASRWATINDVGGVIELIAPLEDSGVLLRRSRERLEAEIGRFRILERDGRLTACAALYPFPDTRQAELACIVTAPDYRRGRRAGRLLAELEDEALRQGLKEVFVLTTQTAHWFLEQGFRAGALSELPPQRQALYNLQRNSKVLCKEL